MGQDIIYKMMEGDVPPFEFNKKVVDVFDDMINRSVPFYREIIMRQAQMACDFYQNNTKIYDLGCSNGNLEMLLLSEMKDRHFEVVAVDSSRPMLDVLEKRLIERKAGDKIKWECRNIKDINISRASVIVVNLTMQFLPVAERNSLMTEIYNGLTSGGVLLLTEKTKNKTEVFVELEQDFHFRYKKENGYSDLEIARKRDALENVLIPETVEDHVARMNKAGFKKIDIWFKWYNFSAFICMK